jgi:hypothetical protein
MDISLKFGECEKKICLYPLIILDLSRCIPNEEKRKIGKLKKKYYTYYLKNLD